MELTRRNFLKASGIAGAAGVLAAGAGLAIADEATSWDEEADVIIVGGGGAGSSAALAAAKEGASVIVLNSSDTPINTSTALCGGYITLCGSEEQIAAKEAGFTVLVKVLESTADMMRGYQEQGADILVPIGYGAGGCGPRRDLSCATLLAEYKPAIEIPMLAAGAIVNAQTAAAAAAVGAEGAYAGTRFLMTEESPCSQQAKDVIAAAKAEELVRVEIAYGIIHMNRSERAEQALEMIAQGATIDELTDFTGAAVDMWAAMAEGNVDEWAVGMDNAVNMIDSVLPAADVVNDLASAFGC